MALGLARKVVPPTMAVKEPGLGSASAGCASLYDLIRFSISGLCAAADAN